jgi:hypothetical protein
MILEEIDGDVKVVLNGKTLAIGDSIEDHQYALVAVLGKGKATFRVDPSCTVQTKGVEAPVEAPVETPVKAPVVKAAKAPVKVEAAPAEVVTPIVETPSEATKEA